MNKSITQIRDHSDGRGVALINFRMEKPLP
jgi:hypothetical protein